jgi:Family of unknown function (DUF6130)
MNTTLKYLAALTACAVFATGASAQNAKDISKRSHPDAEPRRQQMAPAQSAKDIRGPSPLVAIENEPPAKLIVDPPLAEPLARGAVFIQYRAENLRVVPVFGAGALDVSPRIGHIHITVDDLPWHFVDASGETVILVGLDPGPHKVLFQLAGPTHQVITSETIRFTVPDLKTTRPPAK